MRHCLEKNPDERFQSAGDIAFDLGSLSTTSTTTAQKALRTRQVRAWMLPAAVAAAVLLAAGAGYLLGAAKPLELPRFHQITFRRGTILAARIAPDGQTVIYDASWEGKPNQLMSTRTDTPGDRAFDVHGIILSISRNSEMLLLQRVIRISAYARRGVLSRMPISGGAPREIVEDVQDASWGPDGEQMVIVRYVEDKNSMQLEFPIGKVLYTTGGWISDPRVSSDGKRVAFIDHPLANGDDQGQPAVVDLQGNVTKFAPMWVSAQGLLWSPSGKEIWFSGSEAGSDRSIYAVDMGGKMHPLLRVPGDFMLQDMLSDGRVLAIRQENRREVRGKSPTDKEEHDLSWLDWGIPRDITPDGKLFLFEEEGNGGGADYSVYLRGTDGSPAVKLTSFGDGGAISADGKQAIVTSNRTPQQMFLVPTGAGEPVQLVHDDRDYWNIRFLPDGGSIQYCAGVPAHAFRCYRMDLGSRKEIPLAPENAQLQPDMTPDGKTGLVAFKKHFYIWPLDGSAADRSPLQMQAIPGGLGQDYFSPHITQDPKTLIVGKVGPSEIMPRKLYRYNTQSGEAVYWKSVGPADPTGVPGVGVPIFNADGSAYVYAHSRILSQLYTVSGLK